MSDAAPTQPDPARPRGRRLLALGAASVALAPIAAGILITAGTKASPIATTSQFVPVRPQPPVIAPSHHAQPRGALVALVLHATTMRSAPDGAVLAPVPVRTGFGSPQTMWVVAQAPGWLGVISSLAGNNRVGWIPRSAASIGVVSWEIKVSLSRRTVTVIDDSRTVRSFSAAIGRPSAPTPTGRFAVTDRLLTHDPTGPYGCCILALSAKAPHAIQGWSGGNRIAIHSTPETDSIGHAVSHGCVRVTMANGEWLMEHVPLGTPVLIST